MKKIPCGKREGGPPARENKGEKGERLPTDQGVSSNWSLVECPARIPPKSKQDD